MSRNEVETLNLRIPSEITISLDLTDLEDGKIIFFPLPIIGEAIVNHFDDEGKVTKFTSQFEGKVFGRLIYLSSTYFFLPRPKFEATLGDEAPIPREVDGWLREVPIVLVDRDELIEKYSSVH